MPSGSKDSKDSNASNASEYGRIFNVKSIFIAKREETVQETWNAIERSGVILVRGTPCSGKSTLGYLVAKYAREMLKEPYDTVYIPIWRPKNQETAEDFLRNACTEELVKKQTAREPAQWRVFFIIDEAQTSYSDTDLWGTHLKACSNNVTPAKFLLLACYGSTSKWKAEIADGTPILGSHQQIFLRAPSLPHYLQISITFNLPELTDAIRHYRRQHNKRYNLTDAAIESLLHVSCGHAGLVISLLSVVFDAHEAHFRESSITEISAEVFKDYISNTSALLVKLRNRVVNRSLIASWDNEGFPTEHRDIVKRILEQGPVLYDMDDASHRFVYLNGICQGHMVRVRFSGSKRYEILKIVETTPDDVAEDDDLASVGLDIWEGDRTVLVFPTEIHAR